MEQVRSSEVLDREILEDARKKAERAILDAEKDCRDIEEENEKRLRAGTMALEKEHSERLKRLHVDLETSLPLEHRRIKLAFVGAEVEKAVTSWLTDLPQDRLIAAIAARVKAAKAFDNIESRLEVALLPVDACEAAIKTAIPTIKLAPSVKLDVQFQDDRGVVLTSLDNSLRLRATVRDFTETLLDEYRGEIASALFPKGAEQ
jgi:V/A-type H+/Na+-transporting ATPase subunit E